MHKLARRKHERDREICNTLLLENYSVGAKLLHPLPAMPQLMVGDTHKKLPVANFVCTLYVCANE